jgi:GMP synthase (glutamine-hydrolysing)
VGGTCGGTSGSWQLQTDPSRWSIIRGPVKTVAAIRHVHFEDLGALESVLSGAGYEVRYHEAGIDDLQSPQLASCELLVVLGGPIGVYEEEKYPFIKDEITVIEKRLNFGRPAIGICLGAQLFARALGSRVYAGPGKEIGWAAIALTSAGKHSPLRFLEGVPVLHWHGDTFDLPEGAELLASTSLCPNQAFRCGKSVLAFQFHPEASTKNFERWLIGHAAEIGSTTGISVTKLRSETARLAPESAPLGQQCLREWLSALDECSQPGKGF